MKTAEEIIAQIVQEINQEKIRSVLPNQLTKRSGEYRIGLSKAIDIIESFCLEHPPAAPVSREELLQAEINKCNEALTQPNFSIDSYRCYWEGRKTLAEELLSATLPTREQGRGEVNDIAEVEFDRYSNCDGHDACEDFGCAIMLGLQFKSDI